MKIPEDEIIERLKNDDKKALTLIYNAYWKPLFLSSYNLLKNKELCEEIIQDVFVDLWNNREKIQIKISLNSYLYACTRYKVFAQFRKQKMIRVELYENLEKRFQHATPETKIMHKELVEQIDAVVKTLPKKCQNVYVLSRDEQLSHKEIAEKLNISTKTVENHIGLALKVLRGALGPMLSVELLIFMIHSLK